MKKQIILLSMGISALFCLQSCAIEGQAKLHNPSEINTVSFIEKQQVAINKAQKIKNND